MLTKRVFAIKNEKTNMKLMLQRYEAFCLIISPQNSAIDQVRKR